MPMARKVLFTILVLAILGFCLYTGPAADMSAVLLGSLEELTIPPDAVRVMSNEQIIESITKSVREKRTIVNFDTSGMEEPLMDSLYDRVIQRRPDLDSVEGIRTYRAENRPLVSAVITYRYFVNNQDVFYVKPGLYAVLDKKVLAAGESARVELSGENAPAYGIDIDTDSTAVQIGPDNRVTALSAGTAYLRVSVMDRYDRQRQYTHTYKLHILPQDAPRIEDIDTLITAAKKGLGRTSLPVLIQDKDLRVSEMQNALSRIGEGLIKSGFNDEMTAIVNATDSGASLTECADKIGVLQERIAEIISELIRPGMTDLEKETALYDYLIRSARYDYRVYDDPDNYPYDSGTIYGTLVNGTGVCTSYAYALERLLNTVGIECTTILGNYQDQYHMWNIAKIDGVYYHLDPTFDSVFTHAYGLSHTYFNKSDEQMRKDHDWDPAGYPACTGTREK